MWLWRAALITLAALAALGGQAAAVGLLLPRGHVETRSRLFHAAPDRVFTAIARVEPPYEIVEQAPPSRLVTRVADGLPYGGTWTFELAPEGGGTRLTITEHGEVYNPIFRVLARFVFGHAATMEAYLEDLAARLR